MATTEFPDIPNYTEDYPFLIRWVVRIIRNVMKGRTNNVYEVTLTANAATTTVTFPKDILGVNTKLIFTPKTSNAALEIGTGTMYVSATNALLQTATITHANNAQTDRTFAYILVG